VRVPSIDTSDSQALPSPSRRGDAITLRRSARDVRGTVTLNVGTATKLPHQISSKSPENLQIRSDSLRYGECMKRVSFGSPGPSREGANGARMNSRKNPIIFVSTALIAVFAFACALLGANISPWILLASLLPLAGAAIYVILKKLHVGSQMMTLMHVGVWMFLFAGLIFELSIPLYAGLLATVAAIFSFGIVPLVTLVGFVAFLFVFAATRKLWAANLVILSFCFGVFQIWSVAIFLPHAAAH
jgi:hypothetical protein